MPISRTWSSASRITGTSTTRSTAGSSCGRPLSLPGPTPMFSASQNQLSYTWTTSSFELQSKLERCCTSTRKSASRRATMCRSESQRRCWTRWLAKWQSPMSSTSRSSWSSRLPQSSPKPTTKQWCTSLEEGISNAVLASAMSNCIYILCILLFIMECKEWS